MARHFRIINYGLLIILAVLVIAGGLYLYDKYGNSSISPEDAIPENTGIFIKINEPGTLIRELSDKNDIWTDILKTETAGSLLNALQSADSILSEMGYIELLENGNIYLAILEDSGQMAYCILFQWPYGATEDDLDLLIGKLYGGVLQKTEMSFHDIDGYLLSDAAGAACYYCIGHGLCMIGNTAAILEDCAFRIDKRSSLPFDQLFQKVGLTSGRNVDANIYVNFGRIPAIARNIFASSYYEERKILPDFGSWSGIDLIIKNDELLMNGYTEAVDSLNHFLSLFRRQEPQKIEVTRILPYNTSLLLSFGFSDFESLYHKNVEYLKHDGVFPDRESKLSKMKSRYGNRLEKYMTAWVGNEMALALINPHLQDQKSNTFLAIHAQDIELAARNLKELSSSQYTSEYRDYIIRRIAIPELVPVIYGRIFSEIKENYYTQIEDYIVFANSSRSLENLINILLSGKTLEQNENFKEFTDNVSNLSNIFFYFNIRNSTPLLKEILAIPLAGFIENNPEVIKNFEALAVQFKALNNMYFTSIYVRHNPAYIKEDLSIWKAYLDAPVHGQPYFVKDHRTNKLKIVAFDTLNNMYLIDHDGNINWKLNIGEKVISEVHTVDYYRNGKIQYLFNTENRIYLIDLLGRDVEGYPIDLKKKATNGLAVIDYDNNKDYRIMLALDDNRVYNFDIKGKKIDGWKIPLSKGVITNPVQYLREGGKDYIIIADAEGNVKITDRRGRSRINLKKNIVNGINSGFYVNETNSKGIILSTDENGKLTYINSNGKIEQTDFGNFSKAHYFLYEDFDNKGGKDFIFLDGNKLTVFDRFKNVMFSWEFENEINSSPVIIPVSSREKLIGVVSGESRKIYLFDRAGNLLSTPDHIGKTRILIGSLNRDGQLNMIVGSGNTIFNYYFR
ncbi:MAG: DUF3352 domain-containing protein [Bacteroidales bacterium]|nr:DUF3352 domain-containing protein [Bacteroidales bacterium]